MGERGESVRAALAQLQSSYESMSGGPSGPQQRTTTLPDAKEVRRLLVEMERLLTDHKEELWGPLARVAAQYPEHFPWRRGFIDSVVAPPITSSSRAGVVDPMPDEVFRAALGHPSLSACRHISVPRWTSLVPASVESLSLRQAVLTRAALSLPKLRELAVETIVAAPVLAHAGLEILSTRAQRPLVELLGSAELPSLRKLALLGLGERELSPGPLAHSLHRSQARALIVELHADCPFTVMSALTPIAERIVSLALPTSATEPPFGLPKLQRLRIDFPHQRGSRLESWIGNAPKARELHLFCPTGTNIFLPPFVDALIDSPLAKSVRSLHIESRDYGLVELARWPRDRIEELSILSYNIETAQSLCEQILAERPFPRLSTLSLGNYRQLRGAAESPVAERLETLSVKLGSKEAVDRWLEVRPSFKKLRTLVVRGARAFNAAARARLYGLGHAVVWADPTESAGRRFQYLESDFTGYGGTA